jgi:glycosyltransferase involved in cell wall biosynthesis
MIPTHVMTPAYVLITAAYNEEQFLPLTIDSVVSQTVLPQRWVIVSDASTDRTDEIVRQQAVRHSFIRLLRITKPHLRNFAAQVHAINLGCASLSDCDYDFIGNIDADVSFAPDYFAALLQRFEANPKLGLAGGVTQEQDGTIASAPRGEALQSVPHALQLFRRKCFEDVGGYPALPYGGPDTYAEVMARMKGWQVAGFEDLVAQHHRYTASAGGQLRGRFRQGLMEASLGYDPLFEAVKCVRRLREKPAGVGAVARLAGFCWAQMSHRPAVSQEFVCYLRREQKQRVRRYFGNFFSRTTKSLPADIAIHRY